MPKYMAWVIGRKSMLEKYKGLIIMAAYSLKLEDGREIWIPPIGRPYWMENGTKLNENELQKFIIRKEEVKETKIIRR